MPMVMKVGNKIQPHDKTLERSKFILEDSQWLEIKPMWSSLFFSSFQKIKIYVDSKKCYQQWKIGNYPIWHTVELQKFNRTKNKGQTREQSSHCRPAYCRSDHIFPLVWNEQVTIWIKVGTSLSRTSIPLDTTIFISFPYNSNTKNEERKI